MAFLFVQMATGSTGIFLRLDSARSGMAQANMAYRHFIDHLENIPPLLFRDSYRTE